MRLTRVLVALVLLDAGLALAQAVPGTVTFTARVVDNGTPVQGSKVFLFKIFPTVTGGTETWSETQTLTVTDGNVTAELGAVMPLTELVLSGAKVWLDVTVDGTTLTPRTPVVSVPYAIRSTVAAKVGTLGEADLQKRVSATCPVGSSIRAIDAMGNVTCQTDNTTSGADGGAQGITGVFAGTGLTGGGTLGDLTLAVSFTGSTGTSTSAARADHTHAGSGTVTSVIAGTGLTGGTISTTGTIGLASTVQNWLTQPSCPANSFFQGIAANGTAACGTPTGGGTGTVTSVIAGSGLTGGTITSSGTIGLAPTVQNWAAQPTCAAPNFVRSIAADGTVTCAAAPAGVTSVTAGSGLTGGTITSTGTVALAATVPNWIMTPSCTSGRYLQAVALDGTPTCVPDSNSGGTVTSVGASLPLTTTGGNSPTLGLTTCPAGQILKMTAGAWACSPDVAGVSSIATGTGLTGGPITTSGTIGIAPGGVGTTELGFASVNSAKIEDGTISTADLGTGLTVNGTFQAGRIIVTAGATIGTLWGTCPSGTGNCYYGSSGASCPMGTSVVGGGCNTGNILFCYTGASYPLNNGWQCNAACWVQNTNTLTAHAICARIQ